MKRRAGLSRRDRKSPAFVPIGVVGQAGDRRPALLTGFNGL
jgi:hypothetical protein